MIEDVTHKLRKRISLIDNLKKLSGKNFFLVSIFFLKMSFFSRIVPKNRRSPQCSQKAVSAKNGRLATRLFQKLQKSRIVPKQNRRGDPLVFPLPLQA